MLGNSENLDEKVAWMQAVLRVLSEEGAMKGVVDVSTGNNAVYSER